MQINMPYFLKNKDWYTEEYDDNGNLKFKLTDKATEKAIESYKEYYETMKRLEELEFEE